MTKSKISHLILASFTAISLAACGASDHGHDHDHDHDTKAGAASEDKGKIKFADHDKYGHLSAVYECGDEELQTKHTTGETTLAFRGEKVNVSREVTVIDNGFGGETFKGKFRGQNLVFKGKGYDASLTLDDDVISCKKLTCIPLGGPH